MESDITYAEVELAAIAAHPANPRGPVDPADVAELADSLREQGLLQMPILLPADRVAAAWPEHADQLADVKYVVLMGHRRFAAAQLAYGPQGILKANVRTDAIADSRTEQHTAMTAENVGRKSLSPMQEAHAFGWQRAEGLSTREIAARCGASQSHVVKRLQLLNVPEAAQLAVDAGTLDIGEALALAKVTEPEVRQRVFDRYTEAVAERAAERAKWEEKTGRTWYDDEPVTIATAIEEDEEEQQRIADDAQSRERAAAEGVQLVDPATEWPGGQHWSKQLYRPDDIEAARAAGTLRAAVDGSGGLTYYATKKPKVVREPSQYEQDTQRDQADRATATKARKEAVRLLACMPQRWQPHYSQKLMVMALLDTGSDEAFTLAYELLDGTPARTFTDTPHPYTWRWEARRDQPWEIQVQIVHAVAVARAELALRRTSEWDTPEVQFMDQLRQYACYDRMTHYEQQCYDQATRKIAAREAGIRRRTHVARFEPPFTLAHTGDEWTVRDASGTRELVLAHDGLTGDQAAEAQAWATEELAYEDYPVTGWDVLIDPETQQASGYLSVLDEDDDTGAETE